MITQAMIDYMKERAAARRSPYGRGYGSAFGGAERSPYRAGTQSDADWRRGFGDGIIAGRAMGRVPSEA